MRWRLIDSGPGVAADNMAVDEALMLSCGRGETPPTLRFYAWRPPAVSVGRSQRLAEEVDAAACRRLGVDWVRRPTGGRAVLHDQEVTYSVVIAQALLPGPVIETYRQLSRGLVEGMRLLGIEAALWSPPDSGGPVPASRAAARALRGGATGAAGAGGAGTGAALTGACFDAPAWYELLAGGRKVVGSAQMRAGGVILQHGSILVRFDAHRLLSVLRLGGGDAARHDELAAHLERRATGVAQLLGRPVAYGEVVEAMAEGFRRGLGIELEAGGLTAGEAADAMRLGERYRSEEWNRGPSRQRGRTRA